MTHSERTLTEFVGSIYDAAMDARLWIPLLQRFEQALRTPFCVFHVHNLADRTCDVAAEIGFDPSFRRSYEEYYVSRNRFFIDGRRHLKPGVVCDDRLLCPPEVLLKSEFYNDWLAPQGMLHGLNATVVEERELVSLLGLIRRRGDEPLDDGDLALVRALIPHLQRAVQVHRRVSDLQVRTAAAQEALNSWELGVIVLDAQGAILLMNRSAEAIVGKKDGLTAVPAGLAASRPTEAASLTALIRATQRGKRVTPSAGVLKISRERSERPLDLLVAPLSLHRSVLSDRRGATVVFVSDPDAEPTTDVDLLGKLYGLTPAEARLAVLLVRGDDLKSIADHQGVSHNTARTHMKRILEKTHTRRQSELVSLVLRSPLAASGSRKQS